MLQRPSSDQERFEPEVLSGTPYRALARLQTSGMAEVYRAEHVELGREFAVKVLRRELARDAQLVDRVRVEAQALGCLNHPNIVAVVGFGHVRDGRPYVALEYLRGTTLADELRRRRMSVVEAVHWTRQVLSALAAAHALGIVHRDLKPDNLFLAERPQGRVLKVLDFGVARVLPGFGATSPLPLAYPTGSGVVIGTPRFVSPEAALGRAVDQRADLYSAGLLLYTMLAGRGPFDHIEGQELLLSAQVVDDPAPIAEYRGDSVPTALEAAVAKALSKRVEGRFQTAGEFERALSSFAELEGEGDPAGIQHRRLGPRTSLVPAPALGTNGAHLVMHVNASPPHASPSAPLGALDFLRRAAAPEVVRLGVLFLLVSLLATAVAALVVSLAMRVE